MIRERVSVQVEKDKIALKKAIADAFNLTPVDKNYEMLYMLPDGNRNLIVRELDETMNTQANDIQKGLNRLFDNYDRLRCDYLFEQYTKQLLSCINAATTYDSQSSACN